MNRKTLKYTLVAIAVTAIFAGGIFATRNDFGLGRNMEIMVNLMHAISTQYVDKVDADEMMENGANGITSKLDPYTDFIPEKDMPDFEAMTTGRYGGIGALIRKKGDYVIIAEPYKGSPADENGLKIGDKIVAVNGKDMRGAKVEDISKSLRGEPNTTVSITIEHHLFWLCCRGCGIYPSCRLHRQVLRRYARCDSAFAERGRTQIADSRLSQQWRRSVAIGGKNFVALCAKGDNGCGDPWSRRQVAKALYRIRAIITKYAVSGIDKWK